MKNFLKLLLICALLIGLKNYTHAEIGLISSLTSNGNTSGGLRLGMGVNKVLDVGLTLEKESTTSNQQQARFWADYYDGYFGVLITGKAKNDPDLSLAGMMAVESSINDNMALGIGFKILEAKQNQPIEFFTGWDTYLVIMIP